MNLLLWTTQVTEEHYPLLANLKELGFEGVEVPVVVGDEAEFGKLGDELDRLGLERTAVTVLDETANPVSPDAAVRRQANENMRLAIGRATAMGANLLCGPFHSAHKVFSGEAPTDDERERCVGVLRAVAEDAELSGVTLAVEPLNRFECYVMTTVADARRIVDAVDHPSLTVLYDTHHMHIEEKNVTDAIARCGAAIGHVHVSENDRGTPGSGQVAWADTFAALRKQSYDDWLVIESFSRLDPQFAAVVHLWRDMDPIEEIAEKGLAFIRGGWQASNSS